MQMKIRYVEVLGNIWEIRVNANKLIGIHLVDKIVKEDDDIYYLSLGDSLALWYNAN